MSRFLRLWLVWLNPLLALAVWEGAVRFGLIAPFVLPAPSVIAYTLYADAALLWPAWLNTLHLTALALLCAAGASLGLGVLFTFAPRLERVLMPYLVLAQVTPIAAIAPLLLIWVPHAPTALLICAWLVAFFPLMANTGMGLRSTDPNLEALFTLHGASRWQRLRFLKLPSALPWFLEGLKISGGLALIGAVVAEMVAGTGGVASGLAFRLLEAGYQLKMPRLFAALALIAASGIVLHIALRALAVAALRGWHESAR